LCVEQRTEAVPLIGNSNIHRPFDCNLKKIPLSPTLCNCPVLCR
jgi:hypothetical protein